MKNTITILMITTLGLSACNGGGNSSVGAYTTVNSDSAATSGNNNNNTVTSATMLAPTEEGKVIFQQRCASCHGLDGNARNNNAANLQFTRLDSLSITQTIKNGKGTMPPFKDAIADSDIAHLAIYVKSIRQ